MQQAHQCDDLSVSMWWCLEFSVKHSPVLCLYQPCSHNTSHTPRSQYRALENQFIRPLPKCHSWWVQHKHWLNSLLWTSNAIWQNWSGSTLKQVIACCLSAPSHYLNQCWLITAVLLHSPESKCVFGDYIFRITTTSRKDQWVNP